MTFSHAKTSTFINELVHVTGALEIHGLVPYDSLFGVEAPCVRVERVVEMYQWHESSSEGTDQDGNKYTDYSYDLKWSGKKQDSSGFYEKDQHRNPDFGTSSAVFNADKVYIREGLHLDTVFTNQITWETTTNTGVYSQWHYYPRNHPFTTASTVTLLNQQEPRHGDHRVRWRFVGAENDIVSAIGKVGHGGRLVTFNHYDTYPNLALLQKGQFNKDQMIATAA